MPETPSRQISASCHCGNIRVTLDWPGSGTIPARACGCAFCRKHGGMWTSNPRGRFRLHTNNGLRVEPYRFGTKTADFHVCPTCGVIPIVTCTLDGIRYAVFNVNTFENIDRSELEIAAADFEGETTEARLARRRRNWTPEGVISS
jgi:hypothetical protein